jgi:hypothetical protein
VRFEYGSAYDDDAANEGRSAYEVAAERRRDMILRHAHAHADRPRTPLRGGRLVYVPYSPASEHPEILLMIGKRIWGNLGFDVCRRCRRGHVFSVVIRDAMGDGWDTRMLRAARDAAPADYRWTYGEFILRSPEFWTSLPPDLSCAPEKLCAHLPVVPGRLREVWSCLRYWRLTGQLYWPDTKERRAFRLRQGYRRGTDA